MSSYNKEKKKRKHALMTNWDGKHVGKRQLVYRQLAVSSTETDTKCNRTSSRTGMTTLPWCAARAMRTETSPNRLTSGQGTAHHGQAVLTPESNWDLIEQ